MKCPDCKKQMVLNDVYEGSTSFDNRKLENPFYKCPYCGIEYVDDEQEVD